jgi:outer membrane biosynthesis protein TonB
VAKEIWICDNKTITKYNGDILNFKMDMRAQMGIEGDQPKSQQGLRGDASVQQKASDKKPAAPPKPKPQPKLEVVVPPKPTPAPVSVPAPAPVSAPVPQVNDATPTTTTAGTSSSSATSSSANSGGRYIPPHLRRKASS